MYLPEPLPRPHRDELIGEPRHTIPRDSSAAAAALALITEPPGLRFVVVISRLLDAVQCGTASAARLNPYPTTVGSRCHDKMSFVRVPDYVSEVRTTYVFSTRTRAQY